MDELDELEVEGVGTERDRQQGQQTREEEEEEECSEWQRADEEKPPECQGCPCGPNLGFSKRTMSEDKEAASKSKKSMTTALCLRGGISCPFC